MSKTSDIEKVVEQALESQPERREASQANQRLALEAILNEREYQRGRWGTQHDRKHTPSDWYVILSVWMGKLAQETPLFQGAFDVRKFLKRLAQLGAISAAAYEALSEKDPQPSEQKQETT
jgi:hypothetical protein